MAGSLVTADGPGLASLSQAQQWGIFDQNGNPVIIGDTVRGFSFVAESRVSKYPIEQGGFQSYNKVQTPYEPRITFTKSGTLGERTAFLQSIELAKQSLYLFWAVTPEVYYQNVNVTHYDYERQREDANQITVDVWLEEVRQAPAPAFSNTVSPDSAAATNGGTTQVKDVTQVSVPETPINTGTIQGSLTPSAPVLPPPGGPVASFQTPTLMTLGGTPSNVAIAGPTPAAGAPAPTTFVPVQ